MWGLGALREGAAGLVKHGAGAVKHGVEAGAKLLENLDEVRAKLVLESYSSTLLHVLLFSAPILYLTLISNYFE